LQNSRRRHERYTGRRGEVARRQQLRRAVDATPRARIDIEDDIQNQIFVSYGRRAFAQTLYLGTMFAVISPMSVRRRR